MWLLRGLATTVLVAGPVWVLPGAAAGMTTSAVRIAQVGGQKTTWRVALTRIWSTDGSAFPRSWHGYRGSFFRFYVLTLRLTNTGRRTADPYDDLLLTLKVMPPHTSRHLSGFTEVAIDDPGMGPIARGAPRSYGAAVPWQATAPGHTTAYCYIIATVQGESHYGLYNVSTQGGLAPTYTLLFDTGL